MLVSQGAHTFASANNVPTCDGTALIAPRCIVEWEYWKKMDAGLPPCTPAKDPGGKMLMQDTVGAIALDPNGKLAAGVSRCAIVLACSCTHSTHSGGLLLKHPGRIGEVNESRDCL